MRVIITGGGTGGHIYPAVALIKDLRNKYEDIDILFIGSKKGLENDIIKNYDIDYLSLDVQGIYRKLTSRNFVTLYKFFKSMKNAKKVIKAYKPDIVIGMGGYVSAPVVYAGHKLKVPTIIHEQNTMPGLTNKFLSRYADKVAVSMPIGANVFPEGKLCVTGNPRASEIVKEKKVSKKELGFSENPLVVFFGGSRGAETVNNVVVESLEEMKNKDYQILYITGDKHYNNVLAKINKINSDNIHIKPYIHNMPQIYQVTDLIVCRAGATSLSEITAIGMPAILIPSPYVTANHQESNARVLVENGAAEMILEKDLTSNILLNKIENIMNDREKQLNMKFNAKKLGIVDASDRFINEIEKLVK